MELMSNQASHVFQVTHAHTRNIVEYTAVAAVVFSIVVYVQSLFQESLTESVLLHTIVQLAFLSLENRMYVLDAATLLVLTQQLSLYFVEGFTTNQFSIVPVIGEINQSGNNTTCDNPVALVVLNFNVFVHVLVTAVSASLLAHAVIILRNQSAVLFSSQVLVVVLAISPMALSILTSSPHDEARVV